MVLHLVSHGLIKGKRMDFKPINFKSKAAIIINQSIYLRYGPVVRIEVHKTETKSYMFRYKWKYVSNQLVETIEMFNPVLFKWSKVHDGIYLPFNRKDINQDTSDADLQIAMIDFFIAAKEWVSKFVQYLPEVTNDR